MHKALHAINIAIEQCPWNLLTEHQFGGTMADILWLSKPLAALSITHCQIWKDNAAGMNLKNTHAVKV